MFAPRRRDRSFLAWCLAVLLALGPLAPLHATAFHAHDDGRDAQGSSCEHRHDDGGATICSDVVAPFHDECSACQAASRTVLGDAASTRTSARLAVAVHAPPAPEEAPRPGSSSTVSARAPPSLPR